MRMKILAGLSLASLLCAQSLPEMRGGAVDGNQIGSSGLAGVHTNVLFGDPSKADLYSILLYVPAHTTSDRHALLQSSRRTKTGTIEAKALRGFRAIPKGFALDDVCSGLRS